MKKAIVFIIILLNLSGCTTLPVDKQNTIHVHLFDILVNNSSTGIDPKSLYVIAGNTVMSPNDAKISPVPIPEQHYPQAGVDEFYVDVDLSVIRRLDLDKVYLLHSDLAGNKGILYLRKNRSGRYQWIDVPEEEEARVRWQLFVKISSKYHSLDEVPTHVRGCMNHYGWMNPIEFRE